jgi:hypothetical protein
MAATLANRQDASRALSPELEAALLAAKSFVPPPPRCSAEEAEAGVRHAQALFRESSAYGRDLVAELIEQRRAEASRG